MYRNERISKKKTKTNRFIQAKIKYSILLLQHKLKNILNCQKVRGGESYRFLRKIP